MNLICSLFCLRLLKSKMTKDVRNTSAKSTLQITFSFFTFRPEYNYLEDKILGKGDLSVTNNFPVIPSDLLGLKQNSSIFSIKRKKRDSNSCIYYFCRGKLFCICRISPKDLTIFSAWGDLRVIKIKIKIKKPKQNQTKSCLNKSLCDTRKKVTLLLKYGSQQDMLHMFNWIFLWMAHFHAFLIKGNIVFSFIRGSSETCIKEIIGYDLFITSCQCFPPVRWYLMRGLSKGRRVGISANGLGEYPPRGHVLVPSRELNSKTSWSAGTPFEHYLC